MRITFNSPVVLTYTIVCVVFFLINTYLVAGFNNHIALSPNFDWNLHTYLTFVLGHANLDHIMGNMAFVLLLGPLLEWKYGSKNLLILMVITAVVTGVLNKLFFNTGLIGASGIVFLFIVLSSFTNYTKGTIPLTFVLVFLLFVGKEIMSVYKTDNISQFAHIIGGVIGGVSGFVIKLKK